MEDVWTYEDITLIGVKIIILKSRNKIDRYIYLHLHRYSRNPWRENRLYYTIV